PPPPSLSALPPPPPTPPPFPYTTLFRSFALGHQVARDLQPIDGRPEGRVDLVGDAGREAAEGGHLLGRHELLLARLQRPVGRLEDRKSTRLNSSHVSISYAVFCLKKRRS